MNRNITGIRKDEWEVLFYQRLGSTLSFGFISKTLIQRFVINNFVFPYYLATAPQIC